eukprot:Gb_39313 [translate_table: standard]
MDGSASEDANYTEDQLETVREITRNEDYYIILGVGKDSSVEEVRKAYRKLSLKVHPDKNKAPGAEEAFKVLSNAFQCLSNDEMRRKYDDETESGDEFESLNRHVRRRRSDYEDGFDDRDENFRFFFFGRARTRGAQGGFNFLALLQVLPMLFLLLVSYLPNSEPNYALQQTATYQFRKITKAHGVPFFVKLADFDREYPPDSSVRMGLEIQVERDYKRVLRHYCHIELQRCQWGLAFQTPHCDKLEHFETVR